jgi:hypothetical protein
MKAEDIFTIVKELPKNELEILMTYIQNRLKNLKTGTKNTIPTITDKETQNYLLETVFKINIKGKDE